ncbi:MAG TPA: LuxR C-terminal-related transcriptional regulator [Povalibacter sp.]|uniref:helix-turn-helix transcriptional regulator n=1 Tax=Povalibacter sp. TaxID=1962978 RepID=UPI002CC8375D|nr:LuxR C-terminal-related transcriptional regulator [Povalibacter sp.]HMN43920.1 LuxR C-terminal-related transcriptional regulator [Povalibacter sp.]
MVANPESVDTLGTTGQWNLVALTKFRAPRVRRDILTRPALLERLSRSIDENPVTLVCAPGGSGKTTLLAQWMSDPPAETTAVWLTIDNDDNDTNRLFAALLQALEPLELSWDADPRALVDSVAASRAQTRAALAALVNALCTSVARRIVIVLDDLHRIEKTEAYELLDSLIERLPDHVTLVLGTRIEPPLSLARWRAYGELGWFTPADLQFTAEDAAALAMAKFGKTLDTAAVQEAMQRTQGWAAGLLLVLQSRAAPALLGKADSNDSNRHLFAYLAQEVLDELPADLQDFVLRSSILIELSPYLCSVLTGRTDARQVLESLYRRNLFLTAIDEMAPVLRFHDLFRDFLEAELARRHPELKRELHELTAKVERTQSRAIYHLLVAQRWEEAMARIAEAAQERLAHGGIATVERWIDAIPEHVRAGNARIRYIRGTCAWFRWDWPRARRELTPAVDGLTAAEDLPDRVTALFHLVDALNSSGAREEARQRIEQAAQLPLNEQGKAELAMQRAWCATPSGDLPAVASYMRDFVTLVESDPTICANTADRIHCVLIGIPGIAETFERFFTAFQLVRGSQPLPWHISALTIGAWAHLWRGRRAELLDTLAQAEVIQHQFGGVRLAIERLGQLRAITSVVLGDPERAMSIMHAHIKGLQIAELAGHNVVWLRAYRHALGRACWLLDQVAAFREVLPYLTAPIMPGEWPFTESAAATVRGLDALLDKDWRRAEGALREALTTYDQCRMPMIYADARINLSYAVLMQGRKAEAWTLFQPAYDEVIRERAVGLLLLESRKVVNELLELVPAQQKKSPEHAQLLETLGRWVELPEAEPAQRKGLLAALSERELEVLGEVAAGASNKHIARSLSLSLHTVKRHIANILDKLDCDSRGQAADLFRRHS